jgi:1-acyl-sn-glycerol-3-phosphate acyltransferase
VAGRPRQKKKPASPKPGVAPARPALGNDPFQRGAAARTLPLTSRPAAVSAPAAAPASPARAPSLSDKPPAPSAPTRAPSGFPFSDLGRTLSRLLPDLKSRLGQARSLLDTGAHLDAWGMDPELPERAFALLDFLYGSWWRVEPRQIERVPATGGAVLVANHGGALPWDALVLRLALLRDHPAHREVRPLLDEAPFRSAVVGKVAARLGAVPASPENARRLLAQGSLVAVFPEGSRAGEKPWAERYRLQSFGRGGFAKVALRAGAPIVPCAVLGSEESTAPLSRPGWLGKLLGLPLLAATPGLPLGPAALLPLPARWSIRFGEPIPTAGLGADKASDPETVSALAERTRAAVQRMLDEDLAARRSAYL